ncbi:MAG TPA: TerB family tellurite resistance protein [Chitinophagaceae bacterium]|nr:TerB family tellurite resistance protein [Chitinophagaceae bacterium]
MKKLLILLTLVIHSACFSQSQEAKQLLLNVEKLAQLKLMLSHMKTGYQILEKGYTSIKNISQGNFNLHRDFLDGLLQVSPAVKQYSKVADIIRVQLKLVKESKAALAEFLGSKQFTIAEIEYLGNVYANLLKECLKTLDELAMVVTAGKLRMSDDERLQAIDKIYDEVMEQYTFLNEFNNGTAILSLQREKEKMDIDLMRKVHGLK